MTLEPGDIISTGTPSGVGAPASPSSGCSRRRVIVSSPQLGELRTPLRAR